MIAIKSYVEIYHTGTLDCPLANRPSPLEQADEAGLMEPPAGQVWYTTNTRQCERLTYLWTFALSEPLPASELPLTEACALVEEAIRRLHDFALLSNPETSLGTASQMARRFREGLRFAINGFWEQDTPLEGRSSRTLVEHPARLAELIREDMIADVTGEDADKGRAIDAIIKAIDFLREIVDKTPDHNDDTLAVTERIKETRCANDLLELLEIVVLDYYEGRWDQIRRLRVISHDRSDEELLSPALN